jgi:hypothetical protein
MLSALGSYIRRHHVGLIAIVIALGGTAYAATKVGPKQIKRDAVRAKHIRADAVGAEEIASGAVGAGEIGADAVGVAQIGANAVGGEEIATAAVGGGDLRCPAGLNLRAGLCFETTARAAADFEDANAGCEAASLRLPTISEGYLALGTFPAPASQQNFWAADTWHDLGNDDHYGTLLLLLPAGTISIGSALAVSSQPYVCVIGAGA